MAKKNKILLYRTNIKGSTTDNIEFGELALNYNPESPFIMFKDNDGSVKKIGSLSDELGESEYVTMSQKAITEQVTISSDYNVAYPSLNGVTLVETVPNSHTKEAIANIDSNLSNISQYIIDSENGNNTKLSSIRTAAGLNANLTYKKNTASNYISNASSLNNADVLLDIEIKKTNDAIVVEQTRAEEQEEAIRTEFVNADNSLKSELTNLINTEKNRAEVEEGKIRTEFVNADNTLRSELIELLDNLSSNTDDYKTELIDLINQEKARAEGEENNIRSEFEIADNNVKNIISQETSRAEVEERKIRTEFANADNALRSELINLLDNLSSNTDDSKEELINLINQEKERAEFEEANIRNGLNSANNLLTSKINEEKSRAENEEAAIRSELSETTTTLRNELSTLINAEIERANAEDAAIRKDFTEIIESLDSDFSQTIATDDTGKATSNHIGFTFKQVDGKVTSLEVIEADIASAYDLSVETAARKAVDGQTGQTYSSNTTATYIKSATSLNDADVLLDKAISALTITNVSGDELTNLGTNVREAYKLIDGNSTQHGDYIKIYKDSSLKSVMLSGQTLVFTYILADGSEKPVSVDVSKFLTESEYGNGLEVDGNIISAKLGEDTATNKNFLDLEGSIEGKKSLAVRSVDTDRTYTTEDITVKGGPLAKLLTDVGINKINAGTDIQSLLMTLLCKEIYPYNTTSDSWYMADEATLGNQKKIGYQQPNFTTAIATPTVNWTSSTVLEPGAKFTFTVTANATTSAKTASTVSNLTWGYSATDDDSADSTNTSITKNWTSKINNDVYTLKTTVNSGFGGITKADVTGTNTSLPSYSLEVQVADGTNQITWDVTGCTYSATVLENSSVYMVSNLGKTDSNIKTNVIASKTLTPTAPTNTINKSVTGTRYSFAGTKQVTPGISNAMAMTSANIRGLVSKGTNTTFNIEIANGTSHVYIALPPNKTLKSVADTGAFGTDIVDSFKANTKTNVLVEGANGYTSKAYTVYIYAPDAVLGANTYEVTIQ